MLAVIAPLGAAAAPVVEDDPGSPAELSNLGMAYYLIDAVFNDGDAEAAAALVDDDAVIRTPFAEYHGPQGLLDYVAFLKRTYTDASFAITAISVSDDRLHIEWVMTATRYQTDPYEQPIVVDVERPGVIAITVSDGQVADLSLQNGELVFNEPQEEVAIVDGDCIDGPCFP
jgi:hypothetical protein